MKLIGLSEIQKNIGIFSLQKSPWSIIDKRKNQVVSFVYPADKNPSSKKLFGCLSKYIPKDKENMSWEEVREQTWKKHFLEKK